MALLGQNRHFYIFLVEKRLCLYWLRIATIIFVMVGAMVCVPLWSCGGGMTYIRVAGSSLLNATPVQLLQERYGLPQPLLPRAGAGCAVRALNVNGNDGNKQTPGPSSIRTMNPARYLKGEKMGRRQSPHCRTAPRPSSSPQKSRTNKTRSQTARRQIGRADFDQSTAFAGVCRRLETSKGRSCVSPACNSIPS